jgi:hypothetical protein
VGVEVGLGSDWIRQGEFGYHRLWCTVTPMPTEANVQVSKENKIIIDVTYHKSALKFIGKWTL